MSENSRVEALEDRKEGFEITFLVNGEFYQHESSPITLDGESCSLQMTHASPWTRKLQLSPPFAKLGPKIHIKELPTVLVIPLTKPDQYDRFYATGSILSAGLQREGLRSLRE